MIRVLGRCWIDFVRSVDGVGIFGRGVWDRVPAALRLAAAYDSVLTFC